MSIAQNYKAIGQSDIRLIEFNINPGETDETDRTASFPDLLQSKSVAALARRWNCLHL